MFRWPTRFARDGRDWNSLAMYYRVVVNRGAEGSATWQPRKEQHTSIEAALKISNRERARGHATAIQARLVKSNPWKWTKLADESFHASTAKLVTAKDIIKGNF